MAAGETGSGREADGSRLPGDSGSRPRAFQGLGSEMGGRLECQKIRLGVGGTLMAKDGGGVSGFQVLRRAELVLGF